MKRQKTTAKGITFPGFTNYWRDVPPADYTIKVDSLSLFLNSNIDCYETSMFNSGDYKWKLSLYLNGNKKRNVKDHISLYLAVADTNALPTGWMVNINFKFFLYNHISHKYLSFQDAEEDITCLYMMKPEVGFDELIPLATLKDPSKGFLLSDCCIFGVEVFVTKFNGHGECISMIRDLPNNTFTWKIDNFSQKTEETIYSDEFVVEDHKWKLHLYPKGNTKECSPLVKGESISLYLVLVDVPPPGREVFAEFKLRVREGRIINKETKNWFCRSRVSWGFPKFLSLKDLKSQSNPYLVNGALVIEAKIKVISKHNEF